MLVYIGLGSNLEVPKRQILLALEAIRDANKIELIVTSSFYESKPLLDMPGPKYINAVCKIETDLSPLDLLDVCQQIESNQNRIRDIKWGSRTIDLDILIYGNQIFSTKKLDIPHPEMVNRSFVLLPLYEIEPRLKVPLLGSLKGLLDRINLEDIRKL